MGHSGEVATEAEGTVAATEAEGTVAATVALTRCARLCLAAIKR